MTWFPAVFAVVISVVCFAAGWRACESVYEDEAAEARLRRIEQAAGIPVENQGREA